MKMDIVCRIPGHQSTEWPLRFLDDTGCQVMQIYESDITDLQTVGWANTGAVIPYPPLLGVSHSTLADGSIAWSYTFVMEVTMYDDSFPPKRLEPDNAPLDLVQCNVLPGNAAAQGSMRLNGLWMRSKFYTGTSPNNREEVHVFDVATGFDKYVPKVAPQNRAPPRFYVVHREAALPPVPPAPAPGALPFVPLVPKIPVGPPGPFLIGGGGGRGVPASFFGPPPPPPPAFGPAPGPGPGVGP